MSKSKRARSGHQSRAGGTFMNLKTVPLFKESDVDVTALQTRVHRFEKDDVIVDFDEKTSDVFFITSGEVRVLIRTSPGKEVIFTDLRVGEYLGELAAIDGTARSANVTALSRGEAVIVPGGAFRQAVVTTPKVAERLLRHLASRVRELDERVLEHTLLDLRHRLYCALLRLSVRRSAHDGDDRVLSPPPSQQVIADRIGCAREQVARAFSELISEGLLERTRGALILTRPDALKVR